MSWKILVVGQIVSDEIYAEDYNDNPSAIPTNRSFGGKAFNISVAARRLGLDVSIASAVGGDLAGSDARNQLIKEQVDVTYLLTASFGLSGVTPTPRVKLFESPAGHRVTSVDCAASMMASYRTVLDRLSLDSFDAVITTFELPDTDLSGLAIATNSAGIPLICNPAPAQRSPPSLSIGTILRHSAVVVPNESEAAWLLSEPETLRPESSARLLSAYSVTDWCVVTRGHRGWEGASRCGEALNSKARPVHVVNKVGASDVFTAGLALGFLNKWCLRDSTTFAGAAASMAVARRGDAARFPTLDDVLSLSGSS